MLRETGVATPVAVPKRPHRVRELADEGYSTARQLDEAVSLGVSLCIVATDTGSHIADGLSAVNHGLDVLVEKPLGMEAQEASHLRDYAKQVHRNVFVGCVLRFSESLNIFRDLLDEVGRLHSVRIECQSYLPDWRPDRPYQQSYSARPKEGGVLLDMVHEIDYAGWLFGWPAKLNARLSNLNVLDIEAEEVAEISWQTPAGCVVSINLDYLSRPARRRVRASGERGTIEWDGIAGTVTLMVAGAPDRVLESSQTRNEMFTAQACAFVNAGGAVFDSRLATADDGVKSLAVCGAARQASKSSKEEAVKYP